MLTQDARLDALAGRLRENGLRVTPQRRAVMAVLLESDDHPTVEQVHERVRSRYPMTSLATVYKTLALLRDLGELREISIGSASNRYDASLPQGHAHIICVSCGTIVDLDAQLKDPCEDEAARVTGYRVIGHRLDFFGICPRCLVETDSTEPDF
ncbi:MAG: transcriptional repressor [Chloroflexi bacterium]|nr:transcriptional repressor [Chloroflexota bacterium]